MVNNTVCHLLDRTEIVELTARYNRGYFEFDPEATGGTATPDGRYLNANIGWIAFGREEIASPLAVTPAGGGYQHLCSDHIVEFEDDDRAIVRCNMFIYKRESPEGPNELWGSGYYYNTAVRSSEGWQFSEILSFIDRRTDDYVLSNLRGAAFARPPLSAAMTSLLGVSKENLVDHVRSCKPLVALAAERGVSDESLVDFLASALQECAPITNPLPRSSATAVAHVLTHDQVYGVQVESNFRRVGWAGPNFPKAGSASTTAKGH